MSNATAHDVAFNFVPRAWRPAKPRTFGITEIRAPYYATFGTRHLNGLAARLRCCRASRCASSAK